MGAPQTTEGEGKEETGKDWFEEGEKKGECRDWRKGNYVGEGGAPPNKKLPLHHCW